MRWFQLSFCFALAGCAAALPPPAPPATPAAEPAAAEPAVAVVDEALVRELRADAAHLAGKIGERNVGKMWELAAAQDFLVDQLESAGYSVTRQGYEVDDVVVQNLAAGISGGKLGDELIIIGAHYDTAPGSPGADDNASGVAALLALSRRLKERNFARSVRFVFFANEEPPYFQTDRMGSLVYARHLVARGDKVVAMLSLESLGVYSDAPKSQRYPAALAARHPTVGNFVAVVSDESSRELGQWVATLLGKAGSVPVVNDALPRELPGVGWSDHWSFWQIGVPAVMLTDTAPFRYEHYHKATDTPDRLDYPRLAQVVAALDRVIERVANDPIPGS